VTPNKEFARLWPRERRELSHSNTLLRRQSCANNSLERPPAQKRRATPHLQATPCRSTASPAAGVTLNSRR